MKIIIIFVTALLLMNTTNTGLAQSNLENHNATTQDTILVWADWKSGTAGTNSVATGVFVIGVDTVQITYSGEIAFIQTGTGANYFSPSAPYLSSLVKNAPPAAEMIALSLVNIKSLQFSKPINNLFFAVISLNGNGYRFDQNFEVISFGAGYWGNGTLSKVDLGNGQYQLNGTGEPHGVIRFNNAVSSINWTTLTNEYWNGFTIGTYGLASVSSAPIKMILLPKGFELFQNYPNPFNPSTTIRYQIAEAGAVVLKVYDMSGREVQTLVNERKEAGQYEARFNASQLSSGIYFYTIRAGNNTATKKMMLVK